MGADGNGQGSVGEMYQKANLWQPQYSQYENEYEKQLFFAINLVRHQPKEIGTQAVNMGAKHELAKKLKKDDLLKFLKKCEPLPQVVFEDEANTACRNNNSTKVSLAQDVPEQGGNIEAYNTVIGSDKTPNCEEYTMCQYMGNSALEFIGL